MLICSINIFSVANVVSLTSNNYMNSHFLNHYNYHSNYDKYCTNYEVIASLHIVFIVKLVLTCVVIFYIILHKCPKC